MALMPAQCPNCNAPIHVDNQKDAAICEYCGSAFIVEKAIANSGGTSIHAQTVHIYNSPATAKPQEDYKALTIYRKSAFTGCAIKAEMLIDNQSVGVITNGKKLNLLLTTGIHYVSLCGDIRQIVVRGECHEVFISVSAKLTLSNGKLVIDRIEYR